MIYEVGDIVFVKFETCEPDISEITENVNSNEVRFIRCKRLLDLGSKRWCTIGKGGLIDVNLVKLLAKKDEELAKLIKLLHGGEYE